MLNIIVGANASGKTVMLKELLDEMPDTKNVVTNIRALNSFTEIRYNQERIELLEENIDALCIISASKSLLVCEDEEYSDSFMQAITYLCKDVNNIFLDEIDNAVPYHEMHAFAAALINIGRVVPNLWITTHEDVLMGYFHEHIKYYTVVQEYDKYKLKEYHSEYLT